MPPNNPYMKRTGGPSLPFLAASAEAMIIKIIIKLMIENHMRRCFHHLEDLNQDEYSPWSKLPSPRLQPFSFTS
jgi:hypothetical protein